MARRPLWCAIASHADRHLVVGLHGGHRPCLEPHEPAGHPVPVRLRRSRGFPWLGLGDFALVPVLRAWPGTGRHHGRQPPWRRVCSTNCDRADGHGGLAGRLLGFRGTGNCLGLLLDILVSQLPGRAPSGLRGRAGFHPARSSDCRSIKGRPVGAAGAQPQCLGFVRDVFGIRLRPLLLSHLAPDLSGRSAGHPTQPSRLLRHVAVARRSSLQPARWHVDGLPVAAYPAALGPSNSYDGRPAGRVRSTLGCRARREQYRCHRSPRAQLRSGGLDPRRLLGDVP